MCVFSHLVGRAISNLEMFVKMFTIENCFVNIHLYIIPGSCSYPTLLKDFLTILKRTETVISVLHTYYVCSTEETF